MRSEKVTFPGTQGELAARLDRPDGTPQAYALFAHCFTCSKEVFAASRIAGGLAELGVATLRFDFTGLGGSDGEFASTNFSSNIQDLLKAAEFLAENHAPPQILIGHSLGGSAVLAGAAEIASAEVVATVGAPFDPGHVTAHFKGRIEEIKAQGEAEVEIGGRSFRVQKQFIEDIEGHDQTGRIGSLKAPLLVFHSPVDEVVGVENAAEIFKAAKHPKSFMSLDRADHLLTDPDDASYVADMLVAWARRYVSGLARPELDSAFKPGPDRTVVAESQAGKFTQIVNSAGHRLLADEPLGIGDNRGATPYGLLLAGLGACTSMTVRMYADRKQLPLEHVSVKLEHDKIHASDCEDCETKEGKLDEITREVELRGDLSDEQREKLLEIADKCPVHRTLHSEVKVRTRLAD